MLSLLNESINFDQVKYDYYNYNNWLISSKSVSII